jgi:ankyrin repeat protein
MYALYADLGAMVAVGIAALLLGRWWYGLVASWVVTAAWLLVDFDRYVDRWTRTAYEFVWLVAVFSVVYGAKRVVLWGTRSWWRAATLAGGVALIFAGVLVALSLYLPMLAPNSVKEVVREIADRVGGRCSPEHVRVTPVPELPSFNTDEPPRTEATLTSLPPAYSDLPVVATNPWDNFIGPYGIIRTADAPKFQADNPFATVDVAIVVGERGDVLAAAAVGGPKSLYDQAMRIARRWKFEPFVIDGVATTVRVEHMGVPIGEPQAALARRVPLPTIKDWNSLRIRLVRAVHGWGGQAYELTIRGDGLVTYEGRGGVALIGRHCAVIPRQAIERLVEEFRRADFFSLDDRYVERAFDVNSMEVATSFDGHAKGTYVYGMFLVDVPDAVHSLPRFIEYTAQTSRWTRGNAYTAPSLVAERWDFSLVDPANWFIIPGVAMYGDAVAMRDLIRIGAPVVAEPLQALGVPTALDIAAHRGDLEMVRLLLATKAAWGKRALTFALVSLAQTVDVATIDLLLSRGADVDGHGRDDKKTALMNAAQGGVPVVVERLLRAKATANVRDAFGRTALHWAVSWRDNEKPVLPGVDRRRVVELLVAAGTDVNVRDDHGNTPLISEWDYGEEGAIALIKLGADVNARDDVYGHTALMVCRNPKVTQVLLEAGADPYARDNWGQTALDHAGAKGEVRDVIERWIAMHPPRAAVRQR